MRRFPAVERKTFHIHACAACVYQRFKNGTGPALHIIWKLAAMSSDELIVPSSVPVCATSFRGNTTVVAGTDIPTHSNVGPYPMDTLIGLHTMDSQTIGHVLEVRPFSLYLCPNKS